MIRNENEYQQALGRIEAEKKRFAEHAETWKQQGFTADQISKLMEPLESFRLQLVEEVQSYERLKRGQFAEFENLQGLGQILIGLRIARGLTQRELAKRLDVDETMVSRDERNEYHGVTVDRAKRVLDAIGVRLVTRVEVEPIGAPTPPLPAARKGSRAPAKGGVKGAKTIPSSGRYEQIGPRSAKVVKITMSKGEATSGENLKKSVQKVPRRGTRKSVAG